MFNGDMHTTGSTGACQSAQQFEGGPLIQITVGARAPRHQLSIDEGRAKDPILRPPGNGVGAGPGAVARQRHEQYCPAPDRSRLAASRIRLRRNRCATER